MPAPFLLPGLRFSTKCERCGLRYSREEKDCTHCRGLSDAEVAAFKARIREGHDANAVLGRLFVFLAAVLMLGVLLVLGSG